jgi:hypothetical protein
MLLRQQGVPMKRFLTRLFATCTRSVEEPQQTERQNLNLKVQSHLKAGKDPVDGVENDGPNHQ